jgi:PadR family transcriptional regulator AphA
MELTPTAKVLLGMLRLGNRTGYEIKQLVDVSTRFFWAASYGQIYPELKRLEERGLVEGEAQPTGGRARTEYRLTPAGERALDAWLASDAEPRAS